LTLEELPKCEYPENGVVLLSDPVTEVPGCNAIKAIPSEEL
jgi:hypothetical protein